MSQVQTLSIKPVLPVFRPLTDALAPLGEPLARVVAGTMLMPHGAQKLFGWFGGYGLEATGQFFATKLGLPASLALVTALIELGGGLLLALGLATRFAAGAVTVMMAVAVFHVHLGNGYFWMSGGYEYPLMWGLLAFSFVLRGGGRYSLDAKIGYEL